MNIIFENWGQRLVAAAQARSLNDSFILLRLGASCRQSRMSGNSKLKYVDESGGSPPLPICPVYIEPHISRTAAIEPPAV